MSKMFRFYLKNKAIGSGFDPKAIYDIGCRMRNLFNRVCDDLGTRFIYSDFWEQPNAGDINGSAVLVYFVSDHSTSLIRKAGCTKELGSGGTAFRSAGGWISE